MSLSQRRYALMGGCMAAMMSTVAWGAVHQPSAATPPPLTSKMIPVGTGFGPAVPPVLPPTINSPAFTAAINAVNPLTPEQIEQAKRIHSSVERAIATPSGGPARPAIRTMVVPLAPGSSPPVLHLASGNVTTLVFEDKTGAPWPVTRVFASPTSGIKYSIVGNVQPTTKSLGKPALAGKGQAASTPAPALSSGANVVALLPSTSQLVGKNVVVTLQGLDVPIAFTITAGDGIVDYRDDVRIPQYGPGAEIPSGPHGMPSLKAPGVQAFLDGVPPSGSRRLHTDDHSVSAWYFHHEMYVRTRASLATPAYYHRQGSSGVYVYVMRPTPFIAIFHQGSLENVRISHLPPGYAYVSENDQ